MGLTLGVCDLFRGDADRPEEAGELLESAGLDRLGDAQHLARPALDADDRASRARMKLATTSFEENPMHLALASIIVTLAFAGCSKASESKSADSPPSPAATSPATDPATARKWIAAGAVVLDVRTADEYGGGHLPQAANIPVQEFASHLPDVDELAGGDKAKRIVVYCAAGGRAAKAKQQLEAAGYTQVVNGGGFNDLR